MLKVLPTTLTKIYGKDSQAVFQRCFYGKLFLKYEPMHAEYAYFMNSFTFEHLTGVAFEDTYTAQK